MTDPDWAAWRPRPWAKRRPATAWVERLEARQLLAIAVDAVAAVEGVAFNGRVATLNASDLTGARDQVTASIDWGDGTVSSGLTVSDAPNKQYAVNASHVYAKAGSYSLVVTARGTENSVQVGNGKATVTIPSPVCPAITATAGLPFSGVVGRFKGAENTTAADYAALIDWGDGTIATPGVITGTPTQFTINGSKTYARTGQLAYKVTLYRLADNRSVQSEGTAVITGAELELPGVNLYPVAGTSTGTVFSGGLDPRSDDGTSNHDGVTTINQPTFAGTAPPLALVQLRIYRPGDGTPVFSARAITRADGAWSMNVGPLANGGYNVIATMTPPNGSSSNAYPLPSIIVNGTEPARGGHGYRSLAGQGAYPLRAASPGLFARRPVRFAGEGRAWRR